MYNLNFYVIIVGGIINRIENPINGTSNFMLTGKETKKIKEKRNDKLRATKSLPAGSYRLDPSGVTIRSEREAAAMQAKRRKTQSGTARKNNTKVAIQTTNKLKKTKDSAPRKLQSRNERG